MDTLRADKHILCEEIFCKSVDLLEMTDNCVSFCSDIECVLTLCSQTEKQSLKNLSDNSVNLYNRDKLSILRLIRKFISE
jgi:hypothetical protein